MRWSRRQLLLGGALAGIGARWPQASAAPAPGVAGYIALDNLHTGERLEVQYAKGGQYDAAALGKLEVLLRDFRNDARHPIDPKLMDYLVEVAQAVGREPKFSVISGYRSPQTNAKLHERSSGVAEHSLHMQGRAIDVRLAGVDCADLAAKAIDLRRGGVGYYRASNFVHLDTGAFRTWRG